MVKAILILVDGSDVCEDVQKKFETVSKFKDFIGIHFEEKKLSDEESIVYMQKFKVKSVPTLIILNDDELIYKVMGNIPQHDIERLLLISLDKAKKS